MPRMLRMGHKPEEAVVNLRQVDVMLYQGRPVAETIRTISVTTFTNCQRRKEFGGAEVRPSEVPEEPEKENSGCARRSPI